MIAREPDPFSAYKWIVVGYLWLAFVLNQADRQVIFSVFPLLESDLGLTAIEKGLLGSFFFWIYGLMVPLAGNLGDVLSRRMTVIASLVLWSLATFSSGLTSAFAGLIVFRCLTATGEAFYYPAASSMLGDFHTGRTRAFALSILQTGNYMGVVIGASLAGWLGEAFGWRSVFLGFGSLGIVWAVVLWATLREPRRGQAEIAAARPTAVDQTWPLRRRLIEFFRSPSAVVLTIVFGLFVFGLAGFLSWMTEHLNKGFNLSLAKAGFVATGFHHAGAMLGVLAAGKLTDRLAVRNPIYRPLAQMLGLILAAPCLYYCGITDSLTWAIIAMTLFGFFRGFYDSNIFTSLFEVIRPEARATATGILLAAGFFMGGVAPTAVGWLQKQIGLGPAIGATAGAYVLAAAMLAVISSVCFTRDAARMRRGL